MFAYNLWMSLLWHCGKITPMIVSICQHCDEQQFQTLSCVYYMIFSVEKLDLFLRALSRDHILALKRYTHTLCVHLVMFSITYNVIVLPFSKANREDLSYSNDSYHSRPL